MTMLLLIELTEPYLPFNVSVSATTSVGAGESLQVTIFSREGGDINYGCTCYILASKVSVIYIIFKC